MFFQMLSCIQLVSYVTTIAIRTYLNTFISTIWCHIQYLWKGYVSIILYHFNMTDLKSFQVQYQHRWQLMDHYLFTHLTQYWLIDICCYDYTYTCDYLNYNCTSFTTKLIIIHSTTQQCNKQIIPNSDRRQLYCLHIWQ